MREAILEINNTLEKLRLQGISRKEVSDGYHTFGELYYHRMILFSIILNTQRRQNL